jgi:site-specific DNA recombinase
MKAAIYARYSSTQQREESIEAQLRACTDYINAQPGWTLTAEYIDRASPPGQTSARSSRG